MTGVMNWKRLVHRTLRLWGTVLGVRGTTWREDMGVVRLGQSTLLLFLCGRSLSEELVVSLVCLCGE